MGHKPIYHPSWNTVYDYLNDPGNATHHKRFYTTVEPLIKHWLRRLGFHENLVGHAKSIFSDLYLKELKRYRSGKLIPEKCTAQITTYYFPVIKNLCLDYVNVLRSKMPYAEDASQLHIEAEPCVFDTLWGEHKNTVLLEMSRSVKDYIELSNFEPTKKEVLRRRFIEGQKFPDIFNGAEKKVFEAQRKWACRQGKKIAIKIARHILPAIIDIYRLPISKKIDPKLIEKYLLGLRTKLAV
ncbi:sigma-70 family RNA polymerase sigma factor [Aggregatimonas sangjinii]|uniref:Sigma-70 family RNA polymerase sigma factor n=1 Tax=Aggregatimonas sangjinii TaxID=2583587 RepID=A0A5B7SUT2_9FLAO|nr:sigma-70 family RNA polymerase sigma factor [Aggregatimonas sangjinii]QCX01942.1 sigma-70 family RNA polymerase sigma factor [Aggregatimonas sangjinii]